MTAQPNQNIEVKARYPDLEQARDTCRRLRARFEGILNQTDTYFSIPNGRLKLREINNQRAELIEYTRANTVGSRESNYTVTPVQSPGIAIPGLASKHGVLVVVRKRRELYLWHNVRIHLDEVDGLGSFIEFEGVVSSDADADVSRERVDRLVNEFAIPPADQIGLSYSDLLIATQKTESTEKN